jgi:hypothetical protein
VSEDEKNSLTLIEVAPATLARGASKGILGKNACIECPSLARFDVALCDEPQRGSTTKPRVAQRTLGLGNNVKTNPNGVLQAIV